MKHKIEIHPKGEKSEKAAAYLLQKFTNIEDLEIEIFQYKSIGVIETLAITIAGSTISSLLSHFIIELINKAKEKKLSTIVKFKEFNILLKIPDQEDKLRELIKEGSNENN